MYPNTCFTFGGENPLNPNAPAWIALVQDSLWVFTVYYGASVLPHLDYDDAAGELGAALMHNAACNGELDNE